MSNVNITIVKSATEKDLREEKALEEPKKSFICPVTGMEFVFVKGGTFQMGDIFGDGDEDERPVHDVTISDFYIGKYMVTQVEWVKFMGNNPSKHRNGDRYPVEQMSWDDVQEFIEKLNHETGEKYCLPTEAEWEYAARSGGKKEKFSGSDKSDEVAWGKGRVDDGTHPVGLKKANGLGLYDMCGNIREWCHDFYNNDYYKFSARNNPIGPDDGINHVTRGTTWISDDWGLQVGRRGHRPQC
jgi:formylglycine-generating enzyme required for sulfatase activity